jgi:hypothetical protein
MANEFPSEDSDPSLFVDPIEGGLDWTEDAEKQYQLGLINAIQASRKSGIEHPVVQYTETSPSKQSEPAPEEHISTWRPLSDNRPLTAKEKMHQDVGNARNKHKPNPYPRFQ